MIAMGRYLYDHRRVGSLLAPYQRLSAAFGSLRPRGSQAHPNSDWRTADTCLLAFLSRASTTTNPPHARLQALESALSTDWGASRDASDLLRTRDSVRFLSSIAEALTLHSLVKSGFRFHNLPLAVAAKGHTKPPADITGNLPDVGTLSVEVYQPKDDIAYRAYMEDLDNALDLADVAWSYTSGVSWTVADRSRNRFVAPPLKHRQTTTETCLQQLWSHMPNNGGEACTTMDDPDIGLRADVTLSDVTSWTDPEVLPGRARCEGWSFGLWNVEAFAESVAGRLAGKSRKGQASRRAADLCLLMVDCTALRSFWDLCLTPDARTIGALCDAIEAQLHRVSKDLDGLLVVGPYVPRGEARRLVAASANLPQRLLDAVAGCQWSPAQATPNLVRLASGSAD